MFGRALGILDEVQQASQLSAFEAASFSAALPGASGNRLEELAAQLDGLRGLFDAIDRFAQKSMRIRLHSTTSALPQQLFTLVTTTIASYARNLPLLRERVQSALLRHGAEEATSVVMDSAERTLATRALLRDAVMRAAERMAAAWLPVTEKWAKDRSQPEKERQTWLRARVDLQQLGAQGALLETGSFAERLAAMPPPPDEPDENAGKRFSLIEVD
jgi:hypothetical protein